MLFNMEKVVRVLHVLGRTDMGGAEKRTMEIFRNIDRDKIQFDFVKHTEEECFFDREIRELGGNVYSVPRFKVYNYISYKKAWNKFFAEHNEIAVVHGQITSTAAIYLKIAAKYNVKLKIAHARSAGVDKGVKGIVTKILRRNLWKLADVCLTCSELAGEAVFGKTAMKQDRVIFIPDALEVFRYDFDSVKRQEIRQKFGVSDKFVIGHVGSFRYAKNHEYLLKIFAKIKEEKDNTVLLLAGSGELMPSIQEEVRRLGLDKDVIFTGMYKDVHDLYQAMDVFVFPSRYEGLPGTVVEAQISGLKCFISKNITKQVKITDLVEFASIEGEPEDWARKIIEYTPYNRVGRVEAARLAKYDIQDQVKVLEEGYLTGNFEVN